MYTIDKSNGNPSFSVETKPLVHCTKNDLDTKFYSPTDYMYDRLEDSLCIGNPEEIKLAGNHLAIYTQLLNIAVVKC